MDYVKFTDQMHEYQTELIEKVMLKLHPKEAVFRRQDPTQNVAGISAKLIRELAPLAKRIALLSSIEAGVLELLLQEYKTIQDDT